MSPTCPSAGPSLVMPAKESVDFLTERSTVVILSPSTSLRINSAKDLGMRATANMREILRFATNEPFIKGFPPYQGGVRGGFEMARQ